MSLQVLDHRAGEAQITSLLLDCLSIQLILNHELSQVADHLGCWCHLDDVSQQNIGLPVAFLDFFELVTQS